MSEVMNVLLSRRSIRKFTDQPIPDNVLKDVVEAALHAPSAMGRKTWKFTVVTNPEAITKLAAAIGTQIGNPGYNLYKPAALIIPSNKKDTVFGREDNACALQNIFLAAQMHGVGSVWLNQLFGICDESGIRPLLREFGIPDDHVVYGMAALGYADPEAPKAEYKPLGDVSYIR